MRNDNTDSEIAYVAETLASDLAAERKRREGLEDELHLERLAHTAAVTRAEQAERERDEARSELAAKAAVALQWETDARRAGADNAALLERLQVVARKSESFNHAEACGYSEDVGESDEDFVPCTCSVGMAELCMVGETHPGAALLERMRKQDDDICRMAEEIEAWKSATGLERGGDPDAVRPDDIVRELERMRALEGIVQWAASEWCSRYVSPTECGECLACQARTALRARS